MASSLASPEAAPLHVSERGALSRTCEHQRLGSGKTGPIPPRRFSSSHTLGAGESKCPSAVNSSRLLSASQDYYAPAA